MKGLNDFYNADLLVSVDQTLEAQISFNKDHAVFKGHFPEQPVVPGVCTMAIIKALLEEAVVQKLVLKEAANVKFLRLLTPDTVPAASIKWEIRENEIAVIAMLSVDNTPVFKMAAVYTQIDKTAAQRVN